MRYLQQAPGLQRSRGLAEAQELGVGRGIGRHFHQVVDIFHKNYNSLDSTYYNFYKSIFLFLPV